MRNLSMVDRVERLIATRHCDAVGKTTFAREFLPNESGCPVFINYVRRIPNWQAEGYHVKLFFLTLPSVEMAIARVAERVKQGGHNVSEDVIRRRFSAPPSSRINLISISGHKIYGPKGIGVLIARKHDRQFPPLRPLMFGGGLEQGLRPGTLPFHSLPISGRRQSLHFETTASG